MVRTTPWLVCIAAGLVAGSLLSACEGPAPDSGWADGCLLGTEGCGCLEDACIAGLVCTDGACVDDGVDPDVPIDPILYDGVDVLFVIDNSGSMASEQRRLMDAIGGLVTAFQEAQVSARYAFTTTDNGNVACSGTTPEGGTLVLESCRGRLEEFVWPSNMPIVDAQASGCTDICSLGPTELDDAIIPTTTEVDPEAVARPWVEISPGATNLPDGVDPVEALQCLLPPGVSGCGFEAPLESMYKALRRAESQSEPSYGFVRERAALLIVIVTDEYDCSATEDHQQLVFDPDDSNRVFWEDQASPVPTSAVCWNAGVRCTGPTSGYDDCQPQSYDVNGSQISESNESDAVMRPVSRYVEHLAGIDSHKRELSTQLGVHMLVLAGSNQDGTVTYADSDDPTHQDNFGIGPGCSIEIDGELQMALPPVRMRAVADQLEGLHASVCATSYDEAMGAAFARVMEDFQ